MSDSNITKRALSQALKELMKTHSIEKISVGNICEKCGLNRKSFYYHFKDKYDLINWIFYTEFGERAFNKKYHDPWQLLEEICTYFYDNRVFYQKTFSMEGQNSFPEYFSSLIATVISKDIEVIFPNTADPQPYIDFYTDAFSCSIRKWMAHKTPMPPHEYAMFLHSALTGIAHHLDAETPFPQK